MNPWEVSLVSELVELSIPPEEEVLEVSDEVEFDDVLAELCPEVSESDAAGSSATWANATCDVVREVTNIEPIKSADIAIASRLFSNEFFILLPLRSSHDFPDQSSASNLRKGRLVDDYRSEST